ncbi:MAG: energy-coupling factor ABC transporter permease [Gemmataceae bacterium]
MMSVVFPSLWAVHIAGGVLSWAWVGGGFFACLLLVGFAVVPTFRKPGCVGEEEIPRIALLTAAFFVAGLIHVRIGPTSVHLLLNGLVGVLLGRRSALAICVGIMLQAFLLGHGDVSTIGVNGCVMTLPALVSYSLYRGLRTAPALGLPEALLACSFVLYPWSVLVGGPLAIALKRVNRGLGISREFRAGFLTGGLAVILTVVLNCLVLIAGGVEDWRAWAGVSFLAHLPVALIEGVITGFTVDFLARVSPGMLGGRPVALRPEVVPLQPIGNSSSSGTSH